MEATSPSSILSAKSTEDIPLSTLYLHIEHAESPFATLGIDTESTESDIRDAYRAAALRIHPDKAPSDNLRKLHTLLFQKIQAAYDELLKGRSEEDSVAATKRLPEDPASLHARNVAFQEALRWERERALNTKHAADARQAAKEANLKAKNERLAERREARSQMVEKGREKREKDIEERSKQTSKRLAKTARRRQEDDGAEWAARAAERFDRKAASRYKRTAQDQPTAETAHPMWDNAVDERLVSDAEIKGRWEKNMLSGGRSGSVSLSQWKQKAHGAAARLHKYTMALSEEAGHMIKPALTGNGTFSALEYDYLMDEAFVGVEFRAEAMTDRKLSLMDADVVNQYLIEDAYEVRGIALGSLAIKEGR